MSHSLFEEGGLHNIRRTGPDEYSMGISLPKDSHGRAARACPSGACSPGYFKVKTGTGITSGQEIAFCPYCRHTQSPDSFVTPEQLEYAKDLLMREVHQGVGRMIGDALGLGPSGRKRYGGDSFSIELSYKPGSPLPVRHPFEEELERAVVCPHCSLDHAVFGLAVWCSDCGRDIFMIHVESEYGVVLTMLSDIDRRRTELGPRVAARDIENCLEDTVSIYEAVLRALLVRRLRERGTPQEETDEILKRIGNRFQNVQLSRNIVANELAVNLFDSIPDDEIKRLAHTFEKRHPITHNLGIVDRKYLEKVLTAEREGHEIRVSSQEITQAIATSIKVLGALHRKLFTEDCSKSIEH